MKFLVLLLEIGVLLTMELWTVYGETGVIGECRQVLNDVTDISMKSQLPPKLAGHWTSSSCETRPGPEFVLRKYSFRKNYFLAQVFYYADEGCTDVTHSISARGSVKPTRPSWLTQLAYHARYTLSKVTVIPFTTVKTREFQHLMTRFCKNAKKDKSPLRIKPSQKFRIFQFLKSSESGSGYRNDFDCLKLFNFTLNELQLIHVQKRKIQKDGDKKSSSGKGIRKETELFLGDISTNFKTRMTYRPTHYQAPLKKAKSPSCNVCQIVSRSSLRKPPILQKSFAFPVDIYGNWVSERCETRPGGQYLTRHLTFLPGSDAWRGIYRFYRDPRCSEAHFRLEVKGTFVKGNRSSLVPSAYEYLFRTLRLKVTPMDFQMVQYLNSYDGKDCGKTGAWKLGVTQDVTYTKGCMTLGIFLPNIEYELIKAEYSERNSYLFVGQRPSDYVSMSFAKNRPTSFQSPMIKCGVQNEAIATSSFDFYEEIPAAASYTSALSFNQDNSASNLNPRFLVLLSCLLLFSRSL